MPQMWELATEPKRMAQQFIGERYQHLTNIRIEFLWMLEPTAKNGKDVYAKTTLVSGQKAYLYWLGCARDRNLNDLENDLEVNSYPRKFFAMEFCKKTWLKLNEVQRRALVEHELCHCDTTPDAMEACLRPHDVEEFRAVVARYGLECMPDVEQFAHAVKSQMSLLPMMEARVPNDDTMFHQVEVRTEDGQLVKVTRMDLITAWRQFDLNDEHRAWQDKSRSLMGSVVDQINQGALDVEGCTVTATVGATAH
jgi:hypothetical protein